jgi:hypothetical protein
MREFRSFPGCTQQELHRRMLRDRRQKLLASREILFPFALNEPPVRLRNRSTFDFVYKLLRRLAKPAQ